MSYGHEEFMIDLTQVTSSVSQNAQVCPSAVRLTDLKTRTRSRKSYMNWRLRLPVQTLFLPQLRGASTRMFQNMKEAHLMNLSVPL